MKKVLIAFDDLGFGGIQTKIISLANELANRKNVKTIVLLKRKVMSDRSNEINKKVLVIYVPNIFSTFFKSRYYYFIYLISIFWVPNSIFLSMEKTPLILLDLIAKFRISMNSKIIVNIDNLLKYSQEQKSLAVRDGLNRVNTVIAVSDETEFDLINRLKINNKIINKVYNWTDFNNQYINNFFARKQDFVFLGRLEKQKQPWLLPMFIKLINSYDNRKFNLNIYGHGSEKNMLKLMINICKVNDNIKNYNATKNVKFILSNSKFLILTSKFEGLPFILLEAMALGCVVVALDAPGVRTVIEDNKTGILKENITELAKAVFYLDNADYQRLKNNALKEVNSKYTVENRDKIIDLMLS